MVAGQAYSHSNSSMATEHQNDCGSQQLFPAARTNAIDPIAVQANARLGMVSTHMPNVSFWDSPAGAMVVCSLIQIPSEVSGRWILTVASGQTRDANCRVGSETRRVNATTHMADAVGDDLRDPGRGSTEVGSRIAWDDRLQRSDACGPRWSAAALVENSSAVAWVWLAANHQS